MSNMNKLNNSNHSSNIGSYKQERFQKLSEKLNQIQVFIFLKKRIQKFKLIQLK